VATSFDAIVIGAGANGLTAAAALGHAGQNVLLLEAQDAIGGLGRLVEFAPGFRAAPLGQHAGWVPPAVARGLGIDVERVHPEIPLSLSTGPRSFLTLPRDAAREAEELRRHSPADAARWPAFADLLHRLAGFLATLYEIPAFDIDTTSSRDLLAMLGAGRRLRRLGHDDMIEFLRLMPMSIDELVDDWFEHPALKAAVAAGGIHHLRQGPRSGGTTFVLLHYLTGAPHGALRDAGWWREGPDAFMRASEEAARRHGVTIRTGAAVARIEVRDDAVAGVVLDSGEEITARRVVSTADPVRTLLGMVDAVWLDPEFLLAVRNIKFRGSTAVVLYALDAMPDFGEHDAHTLLSGVVSLTPTIVELEVAADAAKYGRVSERPHVELTMPTSRWPDAGLAPAGRHVLVASAQSAPYELRSGDEWNAARRDALADSVTSAIECAAPGFSERVLHRALFTPRDIEESHGPTQGAATHGELTLDQILFMRPVPGWGRYAMPIRGLYLGGAGTHPGPGVVGGAGWLAADRVLREK
jgi:phytoene dehydrogenase-like protein